MKTYTYKNHFKFGYNGEYFNERVSPDDVWNVKYGRCEKYPLDFRSECVRAAKLIRKSTDKEIYVLLSGGVDSEIVARSFIEAGIPITCLIARFNDDMNEHDISYAFDFCDQYNQNYKVIDVDIYDLWTNELYKYASRSKCISPQLILPMWLSDQVDGYTIIGAGECYMVQNSDCEYELWEKEKIASWYRHYIINDKDGCPGFFQYTPELMLSFINHEIISNPTNRSEGCSTYYEKNKLYYHFWDLNKRPIYTGFEKFKELDYNLYRPYLENKFGENNGVHKTHINDLRDILYPIECNRCTTELIMQFQDLYEEEGMTLRRSPYDPITIEHRYYAAVINQQLAGFTSIDFFKEYKGCYVHAAYTFPKFRGQGVNRTLWNYKMKDLEEMPEIVIHAINPNWLPDAAFQKEMLERKGFVHTSNRPDGAPVLTVKYKDLKK